MDDYGRFVVIPLFTSGLQDLLQSRFKEGKFLENDKHSSHEVLVSSWMTQLKASYIVRY